MTQEFVTLPRHVAEHAVASIEILNTGKWTQVTALAAALRAALEQPQGEQEPVAVLAFYDGVREPRLLSWNRLPNGEHRLYTRPHSQRKPLTDEQIAAATGAKPGTPMWLVAVAFTRAIEAAHNIK